MRRPLEGQRVALLAHPASVTRDLTHSLDALVAVGLNVTAAFGPQHGLRGDKQDNMVETPDETDARHGIPVFSLYGETRRPSGQSMGTFDVILVDLQDLGCRIYTFVTTLLYVLEAAAEHGKEVWVLDRPNPAGRPVEGLTLRPGWESFVGAGPMPMRHGLTMGEMARWFVTHFGARREADGGGDGRLAARGGAGLWLAGGPRVGEPQPQCAQRQHGALLRRDGDAGGHDAERGAGHHPSAGAVRRPGPCSPRARR